MAAVLAQQLHHGLVAIFRRPVQRRHAAAILGINVRFVGHIIRLCALTPQQTARVEWHDRGIEGTN